MRPRFALALSILLLCPAMAKTEERGRHSLMMSPTYVEIDPFYATVFDAERPVGLLMVGVGLDVPDARLRDQAAHAMPVLRDAMLRNLVSFSAVAVRPTVQPDVTLIAARLQRVIDRVLGRRGAKLLLAQVALRLSK